MLYNLWSDNTQWLAYGTPLGFHTLSVHLFLPPLSLHSNLEAQPLGITCFLSGVLCLSCVSCRNFFNHLPHTKTLECLRKLQSTEHPLTNGARSSWINPPHLHISDRLFSIKHMSSHIDISSYTLQAQEFWSIIFWTMSPPKKMLMVHL